MKSGLPASSVRSAQAQKRFRAKATGPDSAGARVETPPPAIRSSDAVAADAPPPATDQDSGPLSHHPLPAVPAWPSTAPALVPFTNKSEHPAVADTSVNIAELKRKPIQELHDMAGTYGAAGSFPRLRQQPQWLPDMRTDA